MLMDSMFTFLRIGIVVILLGWSLANGQSNLDDMLNSFGNLPDLVDESEEIKDQKNLEKLQPPSISLQVLVDMKKFQIICSVDKNSKRSPISTTCPLANGTTPGSRCFEECLRVCTEENCNDNPLLNQISCRQEVKDNAYQIIWSGSTQMMEATGKWTCSYAGTKKDIEIDLSPYSTTSTSTTTTARPSSSDKSSPLTTPDPRKVSNRLPGNQGPFLNSKFNLIDPTSVFGRKPAKDNFLPGFFKELHLTKPILVIGLLALLLLSIVVNVAFCIRCLLMRKYLHLRGKFNVHPYRNGIMVTDVDGQMKKKDKTHSILSFVFCCYCCQDSNEISNPENTSQILINDPTYDVNHQTRFDNDNDPDLNCLETVLCLPRTRNDDKFFYNNNTANQPSHYLRTSQPMLYQDGQAYPIYGSTNKLYPYFNGTCGNNGPQLFNYRSNSSNELMYEEMMPATIARFQPVESKKIRSLMNTPLQAHYNTHLPILVSNPPQHLQNQIQNNNPDSSIRQMSRSFTSQHFPSNPTSTNDCQNKIILPELNPTSSEAVQMQHQIFSRYNSLPRSPTVPVNMINRLNPENGPIVINPTNQSYVYAAIPKKHDFPQTKYSKNVAMIGGSEDSGVQLHAGSSNEKLNNNNNYDQSPPLTSDSNQSHSYNSPRIHNNEIAQGKLPTKPIIGASGGGEKCVRLEMTKNLMKKADILLREADGLLNE